MEIEDLCEQFRIRTLQASRVRRTWGEGSQLPPTSYEVMGEAVISPSGILGAASAASGFFMCS